MGENKSAARLIVFGDFGEKQRLTAAGGQTISWRRNSLNPLMAASMASR